MEFMKKRYDCCIRIIVCHLLGFFKNTILWQYINKTWKYSLWNFERHKRLLKTVLPELCILHPLPSESSYYCKYQQNRNISPKYKKDLAKLWALFSNSLGTSLPLLKFTWRSACFIAVLCHNFYCMMRNI